MKKQSWKTWKRIWKAWWGESKVCCWTSMYIARITPYKVGQHALSCDFLLIDLWCFHLAVWYIYLKLYFLWLCKQQTRRNSSLAAPVGQPPRKTWRIDTSTAVSEPGIRRQAWAGHACAYNQTLTVCYGSDIPWRPWQPPKVTWWIGGYLGWYWEDRRRQ